MSYVKYIYNCLLILILIVMINVLIFISNYKKPTSIPPESLITKTSNAKTSQSSLSSTNRSLLIRLNARQGNAMFIYAASYILSKTSNRKLYFPKFHFLSYMFQLRFSHFTIKYIPSNLKILKEKYAYFYDKDLVDKCNKPTENIEIKGYFHSWKYFENYFEDVRLEFKFQKYIMEEANFILKKSILFLFNATKMTNNDILIGIHVRRNDLASNSSQEIGYTIATVKYMHNAIRFYMQRFTNRTVKFLIGSDDIDWCLKILSKYNPYIIVKTTDVATMAVLTLCNHTIITVGSFGWWTAFLTGGIVVYYKDFPRPKSHLSQHFVKDDYYPPNWIGLA